MALVNSEPSTAGETLLVETVQLFLMDLWHRIKVCPELGQTFLRTQPQHEISHLEHNDFSFNQNK